MHLPENTKQHQQGKENGQYLNFIPAVILLAISAQHSPESMNIREFHEQVTAAQ
jgi:hypothetical protein